MKKFLNGIWVSAAVDNDFNQFNHAIILERMKTISYMLIFSYPCFFFVDFFLLTKMNNPLYSRNLAVIHFSSFLISLLYLFIYRHAHRLKQSAIINSYLVLYLFLGAVSSINSQLFTGNMTAYLVVLFAVAVIFPVHPRSLFIIMGSVHLCFLIGIFLIDKDPFALLIKQVNATGTAVISFTISFVFYYFRKRDFNNQSKLKESEEGFRKIFLMNPYPLILMNLKTNKIALMNEQAIEYYELHDSDYTQINGSFIFQNEQEKLQILSRLQKNQSIDQYISEQKISPSLSRWVMMHFELITYLDDQCLLIGFTDVTNFKQTEEELHLHATIDALTGVNNRRSGLELLQQQMEHFPSKEFILCFIDANNLKHINDQIGHAAGDILIKTICDVIKNRIEENDLLFRYGGDEFIVVFFQRSLAEVQHIWYLIEQEFNDINHSKENPFTISVSHGLFHYTKGSPYTLEEILEIADKEMYKEKSKFKKNPQLLRGND